MPVILPDSLDFNALADIRQPLPWLLMQFKLTAERRALIQSREGRDASSISYERRACSIQKLIDFAKQEQLFT